MELFFGFGGGGAGWVVLDSVGVSLRHSTILCAGGVHNLNFLIAELQLFYLLFLAKFHVNVLVFAHHAGGFEICRSEMAS